MQPSSARHHRDGVAPPDFHLQDEGDFAVGSVLEHRNGHPPREQRPYGERERVGEDLERTLQTWRVPVPQHVDDCVPALQVAPRQEAEHDERGAGRDEFEIAWHRAQTGVRERAASDAGDADHNERGQHQRAEPRGEAAQVVDEFAHLTRT